MSVTLLQIRTAAYQRANMEIDTGVAQADRFVTDDELDSHINRGYKELYSHLVRHGMHRAETTYTIETDGSSGYELPSDFYAVLTVHYVDNDDNAIMLARHDQRTRPRSNMGGVPAATYRVVGIDMVFDPIPDTGDYEVRYVPIPHELVEDEDTMDSVFGWEEYVILYAASKLLQKEGSFQSAAALRSDARELLMRIQDDAQAVEMSEGTTVQRVRTGQSAALPGDFMTGGRPRYYW